MRSLPKRLLAAALPLLPLAACSGGAPGDGGGTPAASAQAGAVPQPPAAPAPPTPPAPPAPPAPDPALARAVKEDNGLYKFSYAYPKAAAAIPALKALLDEQLDKAKAELARDAGAARKEARTDGYPYHPYEYGVDWKVVTDLPGWLSLSTIVSSYTGGAHPNYVFDTLLWDKQAGKRLDPLALFASKAALDTAIRKPFCAALDKERAKKRGEPVPPDSRKWPNDCINPVEETLILGSSNHSTFDRIGILVPPYEAGPYAEGDYDVTLPVTRQVLAAVKPAYKSAFAIGH